MNIKREFLFFFGCAERTPDDLPERIGHRATSRLMGMCKPVRFAGVDQRMNPNHENGRETK